MAIILMLSWWYSRGWVWAISSVLSELKAINETFSIPILLRTWFSPWKQITTQSTFQNFFQAMIDNLISRFVGSVVRGGMMIGALIASIFVLVFFVITLAVWPLIPISVIIFPILFVSGGV